MRERAFQLSKEKTQFILNTPGMSARLAKIIGAKPMAFSYYIRGARHIPEPLLMALCRATSKKPGDLLLDVSEKYLLVDEN